MNDLRTITPKRDIARELARKQGGDRASGRRPYHLYVYRESFQGGAFSSSGGGS